MLNDKLTHSLKSIAFWCKLLGYVTIVIGVVSTIAGLIPFVIPAVFGLITVFLGVCLIKSGKKADEFLRNTTEQSLEEMLEYLAKYFKIQGIYFLVTLILTVLGIIASIILISLGIVAGEDVQLLTR